MNDNINQQINKFDFSFNFFYFSNRAYIYIALSFSKIDIKMNLSNYYLIKSMQILH